MSIAGELLMTTQNYESLICRIITLSQKSLQKKPINSSQKPLNLLCLSTRMDKNEDLIEEGKVDHRKIITEKTAREIDEADEIENLKKIEAALFLAARFMSLKDLVLLTDINPLMIKESIENLIQKYNREDSAIEIITKDDMWKMDVKKDYFGMINKFATGSSEFTKAEQETLAVIAYKQPVKQSVIINIRGNKAYEHIKKFIEIGLVIPKRVGHTLELKLSDEFFDYFHLQKNKSVSEEVGELADLQTSNQELENQENSE